MPLAIDSALALSASDGSLPEIVTTPLTRSWLTDTSLSPLWSSDLRMLSATSGDFAVVEHAATNVAQSRDRKIRFIVCVLLMRVCSRVRSSRVQDHLRAVVFFRQKHLVAPRRVVERQPVADHEGRIEDVALDELHQRRQIAVHVRLTHLHREPLRERGAN